MKILLLPILICCVVFSSNSVIAQCPDSILLTRQTQVDSFFLLYPDCVSANTIIIKGDSIHNLAGLTGLKEVKNDLVISHNFYLHSLAGLDSLHSVGHALIFRRNLSLENFEGLESLRAIGEDLIIENNQSITELKGLDSLYFVLNIRVQSNDFLSSLHGIQNVGNLVRLHIGKSPRLENLNGLEHITDCSSIYIHATAIRNLDALSNLQSVHSIHLINNHKLTNIRGLRNLRSLRDGFEIENNERLASLEGLDSLDQMGGLTIRNNPLLADLHGLEQIKSISGASWPHFSKLIIEFNAGLTSITDLKALEFVESKIEIEHNFQLSECANAFFCERVLVISPSFSFNNNGPGCKTKEELLTACGIDFNYASGTVFLDLNCNQIRDSNDVTLPGIMINSLKGHLPLTSTSGSGDYFNYIVADTVIIGAKAPEHFHSFPNSYEIISDDVHFIYDSLHFYLCPDTLFHDLAVTLTNYNSPQPGFNLRYQACARNQGTYSENAILVLDFSGFPWSQYVTIIEAPGGIINDKTITWNISAIQPLHTECLNIYIQISAVAPLGINIAPHLSITSSDPIIEIDLVNNEVFLSTLIVGSYDPNDKTVNKEIIPPSDRESGLEYIIRFQNTGTYPATFIEVVDTLERSLNIRSFEMVASSHPYTLSFPDTNIIKWRFDDIQLPDSTTNELLSHGFVRFKINARSLLGVNTSINNKASIYFDFNEPVVTNTTHTLVELQTKTSNLPDILNAVSIYPNPSSGKFQIEIDEAQIIPVLIEILDLNGRVILRTNNADLIKGRMIEVNMNSVQPGVYLIRLLSNDDIYTGRIILVRE